MKYGRPPLKCHCNIYRVCVCVSARARERVSRYILLSNSKAKISKWLFYLEIIS
jgi:hypothetical protein